MRYCASCDPSVAIDLRSIDNLKLCVLQPQDILKNITSSSAAHVKSRIKTFASTFMHMELVSASVTQGFHVRAIVPAQVQRRA